MKRKEYEKPTMKIVQLQHTGMLMTSNMRGSGRLGDSWTNSGSDSWDGSGTSGGSSTGGWTDNGGSAWE